MRLFSVILLVVVGAAIWAVMWGPLRDVGIVHQRTSTVPTPAAEAAKDEASQTGKAPKSRAKDQSQVQARAADSSDASTAPAAGGTPVAQDAPAPPPRFPTAADIPLGMLGSSILDHFGAPLARTTAVDENGKTELLIYHRKRPDTATVIHLRNGRVVSTVTTAY